MKEIRQYKGEKENFAKLIDELNEPVNLEIYYEYRDDISLYIGKKKNDEYEGRGILYDISGNIKYNGFFKNGKYNGFGKLYNSNILIYVGFFNDGYKQGKGTEYINGNKKYEGKFYEGEKNGIFIEYLSNKNRRRKIKYVKGKVSSKCYGTLYDEYNKNIYTGILIDGIPDKAESVIIYDDLDYIIYKGDFLHFNYHNKGTLYFRKSDKIFYSGEFNNGKFINGILYGLNNEKIYEGEFNDNIPKEGKGIKLYNLNGNLEYDGDIANSKYNGYGKLYEEVSKLLFYEGDFINNKYDGFGKLYSNYNGRLLYEGNFKNGKYDGFGKLYNDFQLDYEGNFENGIKSGKGIKYNKNGEKYYEGNFYNDEINGYGIKFYNNGDKKIEGLFKNINYCIGKYYIPNNNKEIYNGEIINEIPMDSNNEIFTLYNDNGYKIYKGKISDYQYKGLGIEYSNLIQNMILYKGFF